MRIFVFLVFLYIILSLVTSDDELLKNSKYLIDRTFWKIIFEKWGSFPLTYVSLRLTMLWAFQFHELTLGTTKVCSYVRLKIWHIESMSLSFTSCTLNM